MSLSSKLSNLAEDYKGEMVEAKDYRQYGPWMTLTVLVFWGLLLAIMANAVDCNSTEDTVHTRENDWR